MKQAKEVAVFGEAIQDIDLKLMACLVGTFLIVSTPLSSWASDDDPRCDEFTGVAKGLCQGASSIGCFEDYAQVPCEVLARNFERLVGEPSPWSGGTCPCLEVAAQKKVEWLAGVADGEFVINDESEYGMQIDIEDGIGGVVCGTAPVVVAVRSLCNFQDPKLYHDYYCNAEGWLGDVYENTEGLQVRFEPLDDMEFENCKDDLKTIFEIYE